MASSAHVISGEISLGTQHHIHMETHVCTLFILFKLRNLCDSSLFIP
jgi:hypothetical protein